MKDLARLERKLKRSEVEPDFYGSKVWRSSRSTNAPILHSIGALSSIDIQMRQMVILYQVQRWNWGR
jgi:hypothetical protein